MSEVCKLNPSFDKLSAALFKLCRTGGGRVLALSRRPSQRCPDFLDCDFVPWPLDLRDFSFLVELP